jgi:hypothetical protein
VNPPPTTMSLEASLCLMKRSQTTKTSLERQKE